MIERNMGARMQTRLIASLWEKFTIHSNNMDDFLIETEITNDMLVAHMYITLTRPIYRMAALIGELAFKSIHKRSLRTTNSDALAAATFYSMYVCGCIKRQWRGN
jgi:hypothetical protein